MECEKEATPSFTCFVCSRCEFPICSSHDIIRTAVPGGTTSSAFVYELEDLLDLESSVPCYSVAEQIETKISIPRTLLDLPESSSLRARLLGVNSDIVAQSLESTENVQPYVLFRNGESNTSAAPDAVHSHEHSQRLLMLEEEENEEEHPGPQRAFVPRLNNTDSNNYSNQASTGTQLENVEEEELEEEEEKEEEEQEQESAQTFNNTAETRIDLIGVRPGVLNKALKSSSAHLTPSLIEETEKIVNRQTVEDVCECEECGAEIEVASEHNSLEMEPETNSVNHTIIHDINGGSNTTTERIVDEVVTPEVTSLPIVPEDVMAAVEQAQSPTQ